MTWEEVISTQEMSRMIMSLKTECEHAVVVVGLSWFGQRFEVATTVLWTTEACHQMRVELCDS